MATEIGIRIDRSQITGIENMLSDIKNGSKKAMTTAINKTLTSTKTRIAKDLTAKLALPAKRIKEDLVVVKASYSNLSGKVQAVGKPVPLIDFKPTQFKAGAKARIYKANSKQVIPSSFITTMRSGHKGVFRRDVHGGRRVPRLPISELTGPRIEDVLAKDEILHPIENDASDLLAENLDKAAADILRRHNL